MHYFIWIIPLRLRRSYGSVWFIYRRSFRLRSDSIPFDRIWKAIKGILIQPFENAECSSKLCDLLKKNQKNSIWIKCVVSIAQIIHINVFAFIRFHCELDAWNELKMMRLNTLYYNSYDFQPDKNKTAGLQFKSNKTNRKWHTFSNSKQSFPGIIPITKSLQT